jgi:hypothetical protein
MRSFSVASFRRTAERTALTAALTALPFATGCASSSTPALSAADATAYGSPAPQPPGQSQAAVAAADDTATTPAAPKGAPAPNPSLAPVEKGSATAAVLPTGASKAKSAGPELEADRPLLVYQGTLGLEVAKSEMSNIIEHAIDVSESFGGYLVSRNDARTELRVPSKSFRAALKALGELGSVTERSVSAQDVSEEYHDLGVRLKNLESVRDRLEQFLARAANVDEALRVGNELAKVVGQVDQIKGRMQFLKTRATYSSIVISLRAKPEPRVVAKRVEPSAPPASPARMPVAWLKRIGLNRLLVLD